MTPPTAVLRAMETLRVAQLPNVHRTDQAILVELLSYVALSNPSAPIFPSVERLANRLHLASVTIRKALVRLRQKSLIERLPQEHSERTGNFRTVRTRISNSVLQLAGLIDSGPTRAATHTEISTRQTVQSHPLPEADSGCPSISADYAAETPNDRNEGDQRYTRPCISGIHAIENKTIQNKISKSTANAPRRHCARKDTLPKDLQPWVEQGIAPAAIATGMKLARQAGTTLSAVLLSIGERLGQATHPQAYLIGTLRRLAAGQEDAWEGKRPLSTLSPREAALRERNEAQASAKLAGQWFTDGHRYYRPVGGLCEVYSAPPATGTRHEPDSAPIPFTVLQRWIAEGNVTSYIVPAPVYDVSLLRKALTGCMV